MILSAAIEDPRDGLYSHLEVALAIGLVLAIAALVIAFVAVTSSAATRDRMDVLEDRLTPSFAEEHAEAPAPVIGVRRPTPFPRTDTDESDLPLQVASIELAGPPEEPEVEEPAAAFREFTLSDGSVRRFEIKREELA